MVQEPNLAHCLFLYGPQARNGFCIFKELKKNQRKIIFHDILTLYVIQISVSIKKFYWNTAHSFMYCQ